MLADIHNLQGAGVAETLHECEVAVAVLDHEGDLAGLAEAWLLAGRLRLDRGEWPAAKEAFERAIVHARQSGNHRARMQASHWLAVSFVRLPIPAGAAVARVEQLLQAASGEPWAEASLLGTLSMLYAYTGRLGDARRALARSQSIFAGFGAKLQLAYSAIPAGHIELASEDAAAAERYLREGYEAFRAMGKRGALGYLAALLAEALCAQGRFDEAQQMTEEAERSAAPGDLDPHVQWLITRAKLLARRGELAAARRLVDEAEALLSPTSWAVHKAETLVAEAEVNRLAGARDHAAASLQEALRIYEDRQAPSLAAPVRAALASLAAHPGPRPT